MEEEDDEDDEDEEAEEKEEEEEEEALSERSLQCAIYAGHDVGGKNSQILRHIQICGNRL